MKKYLIITIRDNDFTSEGRELGNLIQSLIFNELDNPEEIEKRIQYDFLKEKIALLWSSANDFWMNLRFNDHKDTRKYILDNLQVEIWDENDIKEEEECPNAEVIVIPLNYEEYAYLL